MESRVERAVELFKSGYNCSQAVFVAYADLFGLNEEVALKVSSSFGGGMGGLRETCGAVSAMAMLAGLHNGVTTAGDKEGKKANNELVQALANRFKDDNGSIVCKELLGLSPGLPDGQRRTTCTDKVRYSAQLVEEYLMNNKYVIV
jgi:C_GCAxxG_C_C family probable redox protein